MAKRKQEQSKPCKTDCREYFQGHCVLKIKDKPSEYSKVVLGRLCSYYRNFIEIKQDLIK